MFGISTSVSFPSLCVTVLKTYVSSIHFFVILIRHNLEDTPYIVGILEPSDRIMVVVSRQLAFTLTIEGSLTGDTVLRKDGNNAGTCSHCILSLQTHSFE